MKRIMYASLFLVLVIVTTINNPFVFNENSVPVNYLEKDYTIDYKEIYFESLKSTDIIEIFENINIEILEITPVKFKNIEFKYTTKDETTKQMVINLIANYKDILIKNGYHEEAVMYEQKEFLIESMKIRCSEEDLNLLKSKTKIKSIS